MSCVWIHSFHRHLNNHLLILQHFAASAPQKLSYLGHWFPIAYSHVLFSKLPPRHVPGTIWLNEGKTATTSFHGRFCLITLLSSFCSCPEVPRTLFSGGSPQKNTCPIFACLKNTHDLTARGHHPVGIITNNVANSAWRFAGGQIDLAPQP